MGNGELPHFDKRFLNSTIKRMKIRYQINLNQAALQIPATRVFEFKSPRWSVMPARSADGR